MPPHESQPKKYEAGLSFVYSIFGIMNYTLFRGSYKVVDAQYSYWKIWAPATHVQERFVFTAPLEIYR